MRSEINKELRE